MFLKGFDTKTYSKKDMVLCQDEEPPGAFIVKSGIVKTYNLTSKGEEKPIGFSVNRDLFPLGWIFDMITSSQYYYEALTDCEMYCVPKDQLMQYLHANSEAMYEILDRRVWEMMFTQMRINALAQSKASEKIIHIIHYFSLCFGRDLRTDLVEIPLPITQQDVANFTGLTRETVSTEMKKLACDKIILSRNHNYIVLTDKLNRLLDDEYERQLIR